MEGKGRVCVTGGTGFLASRLIMKLLDAGYYVHTTIRGLNKDVSYLTNLPGALTRLKIFNADLEHPESFEPAIIGCIGVFHVVHPMDIISGKEAEGIVTKKALNATNSILQACLNSKTVKRFIHTSSIAAVAFSGKDLEVLDEESWTDIEFVRAHVKNFGGPYVVSKTLTEKAVLEFGEKHDEFDVVSINPTFIQGPFFPQSCPESVRVTMPMAFGEKPGLPSCGTVHVDDVASAHIHLFEHPNAKGRYICNAFNTDMDKLAEFLSVRYPELKIPAQTNYSVELAGFKTCAISSKKLLETGFKYRYGLEETFTGAIECCKEKGIL